jgi:hypothetical protein
VKYIKLILSLSFVFSLLLLSCDKKSATEPEENNNHINGDFAVAIGTGTNPQYSWKAGNTFSLSIMRTSAPTTIVWGIATPGQSNIASPFTHGTVPVGAVPTAIGTPENTLTAGVQYRISVTLLDGKTGWTEFTP